MSSFHEDIGADLMAYLDGEADPATAGRIAKMLSEDAMLQAEANALRRLTEALGRAGDSWRGQNCPVDLTEMVQSSLAREVAPAEVMDLLGADLVALGRDLAAATPQVDLMATVMAGVDRMKRFVEEMPEAGEEVISLALLEEHLEDLGQARKALIPTIDIVEQVMQAVGQQTVDETREAAPVNMVPFRSRPTARESHKNNSAATRYLIRVAAMFLLCAAMAAGWWWNQFEYSSANQANQDRQSRQNTVAAKHRPLDLSGATARLAKKEDNRLKNYPELVRPPADSIRISLDDTPKNAAATLSLDDVIAAKRSALDHKDDALAKLLDWSSLSPEEAKRLLESGDISMAAYLGALQYVTPEEATAFLRDAVQQYPDNPYLRYMLARNLATDPTTREEAIGQLAAMKAISPDNALPYYMEARAKLDSGDINGALMAMDLGSGFETASAFGLDAAQAHSAALATAGYDEPVAQFLAAATAGRQEYADLTALGQDLMAYGQQYESAKDYETANSIYQAVQQLGQQVQQGATLSNEQLAGFDLQMSALDAVSQLAGILKTPGGQNMIHLTYGVLADSLTGFVSYLGQLDNLFLQTTPQNAQNLSTQILNQGDLNIGTVTSGNRLTQ